MAVVVASLLLLWGGSFGSAAHAFLFGGTSGQQGGQQTGAKAGERAADRRRHEVNAPLIDAHEADDLAVLGDGANGGADISALEEEIERGRARQRHAESQQARVADIDAADLEHRQAHADIAEVGGENQRGEALQEVEQAAGGEELVDRRRAENRCNDQEVDQHAEDGHADNRCRKRERKRPAEYGKQPIDHVHAAHDEIGIGDPHHVNYAEDQVQAQGEQRQHAREQ